MGLYDRFGFVTWGREPAALKVDGVAVDVRHMVRALNEERRTENEENNPAQNRGPEP
jgi:hypothetical protein